MVASYAAIAVLIAATTLRAWSPDKALRRLPSIVFSTLGCVIGALRLAGEPGTHRLGHGVVLSFLVSLALSLVFLASGLFIEKYLKFLIKQAETSGCALSKDLRVLRRALSATATMGLPLLQVLTLAAVVPAHGALLGRVWLLVWYAFNVAITLIVHAIVGRVRRSLGEFINASEAATLGAACGGKIIVRLRKLQRGLRVIDRNLKIYLVLFTAALMPGVFVAVWSSALKYLVPGIFVIFGLFWLVSTAVMLPRAATKRKHIVKGRTASHATMATAAPRVNFWSRPCSLSVISASKIAPSEAAIKSSAVAREAGASQPKSTGESQLT
jgi:hypothetical protein